MKQLALNTPQQMLLALLRSSLQEQEPETHFFLHASEKDWKQCYQTAVSQGVMALAWDGILRLPKELHPARNLKLPWAMAVERYEARYLRYCKTVDELTTFYAGHGITTVQLKGVGFSTYYPVPSHREGGDIDIYTFSSNKDKMSDAEANAIPQIRAPYDTDVYCVTCNKTVQVKAGEVVPFCCGRLMEILD